MRTHSLVATALVIVIASSCSVLGIGTPEKTPRDFFEHDFAGFWIARSKGEAKNDGLEASALSTTTKALVLALGDQFPDIVGTKAAAHVLNAALASEGVPVVIDVHGYAGKPVLIAYEVRSTTRWRAGEREFSTRQVYRLDRTNVVPTWLGHAGDGEPLILLDRIERAILDDLRARTAPVGNVVDEEARRWVQRVVEKKLGDQTLAVVVDGLKSRDVLHKKLETALETRRVRVPYPERFLLGEPYFERLEPYAEPSRPGGPWFMRTDLKALRAADRALGEESRARVLRELLDVEVRATEAHEAHHVAHGKLDPALVPAEVMEAVGDDLAFASTADAELRAYFGELHATSGPPCIGLARIARITAGAHTRETAHHDAGRVLFFALTKAWPTSPNDVAKALRTHCELDESVLRERAAEAYTFIYKEPLPTVTRVTHAAR
jgi:hypothetical protein